jgi:SMI1 / KNR4 family (SUKH-1)
MTVNEFLRTMNSRGSGASEKSVALFEKELGAKLPADYRDFLLECNGGACGGSVIFKRNGPSVHHILGLRSENHLSLSWYLKLLRKGEGPPVPEDLLPIMDDPGGSPICLAWKGRNLGAVYAWSFRSTKRLAASFSDFIKGLRDAPEDEDD